jgi:hypothetical protein
MGRYPSVPPWKSAEGADWDEGDETDRAGPGGVHVCPALVDPVQARDPVQKALLEARHALGPVADQDRDVPRRRGIRHRLDLEHQRLPHCRNARAHRERHHVRDPGAGLVARPEP